MNVEELVLSYFPELTEIQKEKFALLEGLYREWNEKINVISRKDMDFFGIHHVLHSLAIAKVIRFKAETRVMDVGTGGGFPGIPLAILFPEVEFYLVEQTRVEQTAGGQDFIVSRAVTAFPAFVGVTRNKIRKGGVNDLPNGILYLKGGDFEEEIKAYAGRVKIFSIPEFFKEDFFETKKVIYLER